ncbi:unnamed protein product [Mytilus edulis]|uniref:B box-type domain-containing protein n=1 Tax=Mytilus edulis TaxID=6550 RepID=A0A8S3TZ11_MYTED|nr:unnamed protein product [Mytilus edulis]
MSDLILCGPCGYTETEKNAENWCTVCEEGLCADCEKVHKSIKTSRDHRLISIEDFRQIQNISVSFNCKDHDRRLELYCKTHDVAVCLGCISRHRACSDVIPLDKAAENAKGSTALADLEESLTRTLQNLQEIITDRDSALTNFEDHKQTIKNKINNIRVSLVKKLEEFEHNLLLELDTKHNNCKSELNKLLNRLKKSEQNLGCLREQTLQLKSFASDIHLFFGTRQINEAVNKEVEAVKETIKSVPNYEINLQLHTTITTLMNEVGQLGNIFFKKTTTCLPFKGSNVEQAQIQLRVFDMKSIDHIYLRLKKRFKVKKDLWGLLITGCTMLTNGNVLIANFYGPSVLMEYSEEGEHIRDIPCSKPTFDVTVLDAERIAVTYGNSSDGNIDILNIKNNTNVQKVKLNSRCFGISYQDNTGFIIRIQDCIVITNIAGKVLKKLNFGCGSYIGTTRDRMYFTNGRDHTVNCISMAGEKIWVCKEESLVNPSGLTVDDHQNVFVIDQGSKSLIVIQHDGKSSRTLLSKTEGLINPMALHYNKGKQMLLLCDEDECALYNVM